MTRHPNTAAALLLLTALQTTPARAGDAQVDPADQTAALTDKTEPEAPRAPVAPAPSAPSGQDYSAHIQATSVTQYHPAIHSPYAGPASLNKDAEYKTSYTATFFFGYRLWQGGEIYLNPEGQMGSGFSKTTGIAGFPNGEIYRVDDPRAKGSWARVYFKQMIGLGGGKETIADDLNQVPETVDVARLTIVAGKFALNDFFDNNKYSHDPRTQFLNWGFMDGAAWDYAADTRGYSQGGMIELNQASWALRYAAMEEPKVANQMWLDEDHYPRKIRGDNLELEVRYALAAHPGTTRLLGFMNHAHMGNYRQAVAAAAPDAPDVAATRTDSIKRGVVLNIEQEIATDLGIFSRLSWNDGVNETWAFTEVDRSVSLGISGQGARWGHPGDGAGLAVMVNGLSAEHRDYLAAGGSGFIVGDGRLNYAYEEIAEAYYNAAVLGALHVSPDLQYVLHPAYNKDRGPVPIVGVRVHFQI